MIEYKTDFFRLGASIHTMAQAYLRTLRRTGRSTQFIKSLKDGDIVVVLHEADKKIIRYAALDSGIKKIDFVVYNLNNTDIFVDPLEELRGLPALRGFRDRRIVFDHTWVEQYYIHTIHRMQQRLVYFGVKDRLETQNCTAYIE